MCWWLSDLTALDPAFQTFRKSPSHCPTDDSHSMVSELILPSSISYPYLGSKSHALSTTSQWITPIIHEISLGLILHCFPLCILATPQNIFNHQQFWQMVKFHEIKPPWDRGVSFYKTCCFYHNIQFLNNI